jgi:hypothetical protein
MRNPIIIIIMLAFSSSFLRSEQDTLGIVVVKDPIKINANTLEFNIQLKNTSDRWNWWANGSFQFELALDIEKTKAGNFDFIHINDESENNVLPDKYLQILTITENSFMVNIIGPNDIGDCVYIPKDSTIILGKYRIISKDNFNFSDSLQWKKPIEIWQSCAYKADNDSIVGAEMVWFSKNDNIEMMDRHNTTICGYTIERMPPPQFILKHFHVNYIGSGIATIKWETESEAYNKGFSLKRATSYFGIMEFDPATIQIISDFNTNPAISGADNFHGKLYPIINDTLPQENFYYKYYLEYTDYSDDTHRIDSAVIFYPRSIISYAQANPNPFTDRTVIDYIAEDDVIVTATVYDMEGKICLQIMNENIISQGEHSILIECDQLHSSGLYELIITAKPVNSSNDYINQSIIKLHLLN